MSRQKTKTNSKQINNNSNNKKPKAKQKKKKELNKPDVVQEIVAKPEDLGLILKPTKRKESADS